VFVSTGCTRGYSCLILSGFWGEFTTSWLNHYNIEFLSGLEKARRGHKQKKATQSVQLSFFG